MNPKIKYGELDQGPTLVMSGLGQLADIYERLLCFA
jgi:hypothetical protein